MHRPLLLVATLLLCAARTASAAPAPPMSCTIAADQKSVRVTLANPYAKRAECSADCKVDIGGGQTLVSCTKTLDPGAAQVEMCVQRSDDEMRYLRVAESSAECLDPDAVAAPPPANEPKDDAKPDDDDDDQPTTDTGKKP